MLQGFFAISIGFKFRKISQSIPFQVSSVLCPMFENKICNVAMLFVGIKT